MRRFGNERPGVTVEWATLIGRVAEGDREAFRSLFEHFAPRVKGLMLKAGANSDDATATPVDHLGDHRNVCCTPPKYRAAGSLDRLQR